MLYDSGFHSRDCLAVVLWRYPRVTWLQHEHWYQQIHVYTHAKAHACTQELLVISWQSTRTPRATSQTTHLCTNTSFSASGSWSPITNMSPITSMPPITNMSSITNMSPITNMTPKVLFSFRQPVHQLGKFSHNGYGCLVCRKWRTSTPKEIQAVYTAMNKWKECL